jgi:hypothetical protein
MHPLSLMVWENRNFFNEAQPDIGCMYCTGFCDDPKGAKTAPTSHQDIHVGTSHAREVNYMIHDTLHGHKLYCSLNCVKAALCDTNQSLFLTMCKKVYKMKHLEAMAIVKALPPWTLIEFSGVLTLQQHRQWSKTKKITGIYNPITKKKFTIDCSGIENASEAYRQAVNMLKGFNRFAKFVFDPKDPFWYTAQPEDTKLVCYHDYHSLAGIKPIPAVLDYNSETGQTIECIGHFCGQACVNNFIIRLLGQFQKARIQWQAQFYAEHFTNGRQIEQTRAPSKRLLKRFGGFMDIDEFRENNTNYKSINEAPVGQDFPFYARLTIDNFYQMIEEVLKYNALDLMNSKRKLQNENLKMDGDEYKLGAKYFEKRYHTIQGNNEFDMKIHFVCITIPQVQEVRSNPETFAAIINKTQSLKRERALISRMEIEESDEI